jgi:hypothetical protein
MVPADWAVIATPSGEWKIIALHPGRFASDADAQRYVEFRARVGDEAAEVFAYALEICRKESSLEIPS